MESGMDLALAAIESNLAAQVFNETLPLVGNNFRQAWENNVAAFRFLTTMRTQIGIGLASFTGAADYDPATVASTVKNRLTTNGGFPTSIVVAATTTGGEAQLAFTITRTYAATDVAIEPDIGLPNLTVRLGGAPVARTVVSPSMSFTMGTDGSGFYLQTTGATFQVNTTTTISALSVAGTFAGLPHAVTRNATNLTSVPANFAVLLKDPGNDGKLRSGELGGNPDLLDATVSGSTKVTLKVDSTFPSSAMVPRAGSDLQLLWNFASAVVDPGDNNATFGGQPDFLMDNNRVNLDSFMHSFASRTLDQIESATEPFRPVIDVLTLPIPVLSDLGSEDVTFLEILGADDTTVAAIGGLNDILDLANLAASFTVNATTVVDLGSYSLGAGDFRVEPLEDVVGIPTRLPSPTRPSQLVTFMNGVNAVTGLAFPVLENPDVVAQLLLGRAATLFSYQSEEAELGFDFEQFYPVFGPIGVTLGGFVNLKSQFAFGYDTQGVIDYYEGGGTDSNLLLNGFYAQATDNSGNPLNGIWLEAGITAGIELNAVLASVGVEGDLTATVGLYLDYQIGDEQGRIRGNVFDSLPLDDWFYAEGSLSAGLHAYVEIGWPPFGVSFDFDSPRVTLISFDSRDNTTPVLAEPDLFNPGQLVLNVGDRAPRRLYGNLDDRAEELLISQDSGDLVVKGFNEENTFPMPTLIVGNGNLRGDTLSVAEDVIIPTHFTGGDGRDILRGGAGNDELTGGAGPDLLNGRFGNDLLVGGLDNDELIAGDGNDTFDGGDGLDTASWAGASSAAAIDLRSGSFTGAASGDTFSSIERYKGSSHNDTFDGSESADSLLHGGAGNDTVRGHGGDDQLEGGTGDDALLGGGANDLLVGGTGADSLDGGAGNDIASYLGAESPVSVSLQTATGTRGDALGDTLANMEALMGSGLPKTEVPAIFSGDVLEGNDGDNIVYGMDGADDILGGGGNDTLWGNHPDIPGAPRTGYDNDDIVGGAGNDVLYGQVGDDELDGGDGNDTLFGAIDNDHLITNDLLGIDVLDGEVGINRLSADYSEKSQPFIFTVGPDNAFAFPDGDQFVKIQTLGTLRTGSGNDVIRLAALPEHVWWRKNIDAGPGDDLVLSDHRGFYPLAGVPTRTTDILAGGDGNDTISFEQSFQGVTANLATKALSGGASGMSMSGFENIVGTPYIDNLTGDAGPNVFTPLHGAPNAASQQDRVDGGAGINTLVVDYTNDPQANLYGVQMADFIQLYVQTDIRVKANPTYAVHSHTYIEQFHVTGGDGPDSLYGLGPVGGAIYSSGNDRLIGAGGNDQIRSNNGDDYLDGGPGDDYLESILGTNTILGGPGNDSVLVHVRGQNTIDAGPGDDFVDNATVNVLATTGDIMRFDGGTGFDVMKGDFSHATAPMIWDDANPSEFSLPDGGYVRGFERYDRLGCGSGNDFIVFRGRNDSNTQLRGGNDTIDPGLGIDTVHGGSAGIDVLILDYSIGDDADTSGVSSNQRRKISTGVVIDQITAAHFESVHFTGGSKADSFTGFNLDDIFHGGDGNDSFTGEAGNDQFDGGPGADTMTGGPGNDFYTVDNPGDTIVEFGNAGTDTVRSSINYTLVGNDVEHLVLGGAAIQGVGNLIHNTITGNSLNNQLRGDSGHDTLDGGGGAGEIDHLNGGLGSDTFVLGYAGANYYDDHTSGTPGHAGYAIIEDFTPSETDRLRLAKPAGGYLLGSSPIAGITGTAVYHDSDGSGALNPTIDELLAILQSAEALTVANTLTNATLSQLADPALVGLVASIKTVTSGEPVGSRFGIQFTINSTIPSNVRLDIQSSNDMGKEDPWLTIATKTGASAWSGLSPVVSESAGSGRVTLTIHALNAISDQPRHFMRLVIIGL